MNMTLKKIWNLVSWALAAAVVVLAILLAGVRVAGITPYVVLSGSMEPTYPVGSMIYVREVQPGDVAEGDPITFHLNEGLIATHRVVEINKEEQSFLMKGDANEGVDAPVPFDQLIGKPLFCIPELGRLSSWIAHPPGMYVAGCFTVGVLVLMFLPEILDMADEADKKDQQKERERLERENNGPG